MTPYATAVAHGFVIALAEFALLMGAYYLGRFGRPTHDEVTT